MLKKLFSKFALAQSTKQAAKLDPLNQTLWRWSQHDPHTVRDSVANWIVFGATGMGKSTGPSAFIAMQHLSAGFGGMFASIKPTDLNEQLEWCHRTGRMDDVIVFGPGQPWRFNFLEYELRRGTGGGVTENIMQVLLSVLELRERRSGKSGGGENGEFFENAKKQILRAAIDVLVMGRRGISVNAIYNMITSAPTTVAMADSAAWRKSSFCYQSLVEADQRETDRSRREDLALSAHYWLREFAALTDRTRTSVTSTVTGAINLLQRGFLRDCLCTTTNITPMDVAQSKVLLYALSLKDGGEAAAILQVIMKHAIQTDLERRNLSEFPNPCFLHIDEFQNLFTSYDSKFAATCRSSRVSFGLLSQSLPVLCDALGGDKNAEVSVQALLANLNLKVFCANGCSETNKMAAELIGQRREYMINSNNSGGDDDYFSVLCGTGSRNSSTGISESYEYEVPPQKFTQLRPGGPPHFVVDAILFRPGWPFKATGRNWMPVTFNQQ